MTVLYSGSISLCLDLKLSLLILCIYLQAIPDNLCKAAGCKAVWGYGNRLFVTAGCRKPFRGTLRSVLFFTCFRDFDIMFDKENEVLFELIKIEGNFTIVNILVIVFISLIINNSYIILYACKSYSDVVSRKWISQFCCSHSLLPVTHSLSYFGVH